MSQDLKKEKSIKISHDNFSFFFPSDSLWIESTVY